MRQTDLFEMLEGAHDAAFVVDQGGKIRFWSSGARRLLGVPAADALDKHCAVVLDGLDSVGAHVCAPDCTVLELSRASTRISAYDLEVRTGSGARRWVNVSVIVARLSSGERLLVHLMRDIDSRKKLEDLTKEIVVQVGRLTGQEAEQILDRARAQSPATELTAQERRILRLLSLGRSTAAIGQELHVSPATVRNHIQHVLRKLGAHSRLEAVMRASRERLL